MPRPRHAAHRDRVSPHLTLVLIRSRGGFTLIELVLTLAILLTLASVILPRMSVFRQRGAEAAVASDLRNLATMQEILRATEGEPADDIDDPGLQFSSSEKVTISIEYTLPDGSWAATGSYLTVPDRVCAVAIGPFVPPGYEAQAVHCSDT